MSLQTAFAFTRAAPSYWLSVYPQVRGEVAWQRHRAERIPDARLRRIALGALDDKRANLDGAAAFAAFVPRALRPAVIGAQVSFQALYDYLDTLTEQPHPDPVRNSRRLHGALTAALDLGASGGDYYAHSPVGEDGGYLHGTVERCRTALRALPGYPGVQPSASRLAAHIVSYQSFNVTDAPGPQRQLARWAGEHTPPGSGLQWWETAASAGSSLGLFALIAMASRPQVSAIDALAVERAYFPWIGALHSLLDSLVDRAQDRANGQQALVDYYPEGELACRLRLLAEESRRRTASLPHPASHAAVLASMAGMYLSEREAGGPYARQARREVLTALGGLSAPAAVVMRARRLALSR